MDNELSFIWRPSENLKKDVDKFFEHYRKGIITISESFPEINTVQGLIQKDLTIIKMYELISKGVVQDMFQTTIDISYDIEKTEYNLHEKFPQLKNYKPK